MTTKSYLLAASSIMQKVFLHAVSVRRVKEVQRFVGEQTMPKLLVACNWSEKKT